jgi:chromosome segregation ATPase
MALVLREVELNRRDAALRRAEEARAEDEGSLSRASSALEAALEARLVEVDRRARELQMAVQAVEAQRERLESMTREYEERRDALGARAREVEGERARLRDEQAQIVCATLELEERDRPVDVGVRPAAFPASIAVSALETVPAPESEPEPIAALNVQERSDKDWWSKQLGSPLEAA